MAPKEGTLHMWAWLTALQLHHQSLESRLGKLWMSDRGAKKPDQQTSKSCTSGEHIPACHIWWCMLD